MTLHRLFRLILIVPTLAFLAGCNAVVLAPAGDIAVQQRDLVLIATGLMLLIIIPVLALTVLFAWHYRKSNTKAEYDPEWHHSTQLELVIWAAPLLIIICLGAVTWVGTHLLDPYRALDRIAPGQPVTADMIPLEVEVVALDWKWLFIYPQYNIASVNELAAPVNRPISFKITSSSVMNSFYIPALAGQIYAMPGMETKMQAVVNTAGDYEGFSANYSGHGFSGMRFRFHGLDDAAFEKWIADVKTAPAPLERTNYLELEKPSEHVPVQHYPSVAPDLYAAILNMCVELDKMCMSEMNAIDAKGGLGLEGVHNVAPVAYDKYTRRGTVADPNKTYVAAICTPDEALASGISLPPLPSQGGVPFVGVGLTVPGNLQSDAQSALSWLAGFARPSVF